MNIVADPRLDLFSRPPTTASLSDIQHVSYKPIAAISDQSPIEFTISAGVDSYLSLCESTITLKLQLLDSAGAHIAAPAAAAAGAAAAAAPPVDPTISPSCNYLHNLFSEVEVYANGTVISQNSNLYPYRAYFTNLLANGTSSKDCELITEGWITDNAGEQGLITGAALLEREKWVKHSKVHYLHGQLKSELFQTNKLLPSGVELRVRCTPNKNNCILIASAGAPIVKILDAVLTVPQYRVDADILASIEQTLTKSNILIPVVKTQMKVFHVPSGLHSKSLDNLYPGQSPGRITLGITSHSAYSGSYTDDIHKYDNFNITDIHLTINGRKFPSTGFATNFPGDNFNAAYLSTFNALHTYKRNKSHGITREHFKDGMCIFSFDVSADNSFGEGALSARDTNNYGLSITFGGGLGVPISIIIMAEMESVITVNKHREVAYEQ
jgi:hypothetical protein